VLLFKKIILTISMSDLLLHSIALTLVPGIGDINARKLIQHCGSAEAVFKEKKERLSKIEGIGIFTLKHLSAKEHLKKAEKEIKFMNRYGIKALLIDDKEYPFRLRQCADAPLLLFYKGNASLNARKVISIIGTRRATDYGRTFCENFVKDLTSFEPLIVSGLALGIDGCAHREALNNQLNTIGVLGHGLDRIYPTQHRNLAAQMIEQGGLLTDFLSETNPDRENFPKRNRIVAGMCDATIVVEAGDKGGALITADIANSYSRDVFAVPGRINDPWSLGCNRYIKCQKAALIENAADLIYQMGWVEEVNAQKNIQTKLFVDLNNEEQKLVELLQTKGSLGLDEIAYSIGLSVSVASAQLLGMEFKGLIKSLPGKMYRVI
jgi:DNA processing protein